MGQAWTAYTLSSLGANAFSPHLVPKESYLSPQEMALIRMEFQACRSCFPQNLMQRGKCCLEGAPVCQYIVQVDDTLLPGDSGEPSVNQPLEGRRCIAEAKSEDPKLPKILC